MHATMYGPMSGMRSTFFTLRRRSAPPPPRGAAHNPVSGPGSRCVGGGGAEGCGGGLLPTVVLCHGSGRESGTSLLGANQTPFHREAMRKAESGSGRVAATVNCRRHRHRRSDATG
jgi:hypothetical protein